DRRRGHVRPAGIDDSRALFGRSRHDGRERFRLAVDDDPESDDGLGADAADGHPAVREPVLAVHTTVLKRAFMADFSSLDHDELIRRLSRDLEDSYDEELELEIEDRDPLAGGAPKANG